eukprot:scaffold39132_cov290-Amphora_coffeaeformis.AAC.1
MPMRSAQRIQNSSRKKAFTSAILSAAVETSRMRCKLCGRGVIKSNLRIQACRLASSRSTRRGDGGDSGGGGSVAEEDANEDDVDVNRRRHSLLLGTATATEEESLAVVAVAVAVAVAAAASILH